MAVLLGAALAAGALALLLVGDEEGRGAACGSVPRAALTPPGSGPEAFTMGLRVNDARDVESIQSELGSRVLPRDVFIVNTEQPGTDADDWEATLDELEERFPCNRVAALNGLGDRGGRAGDIHALADEPEVDAILLDWEPDTWKDTGQGAWSSDLDTNADRMSERLDTLAGGLRNHPHMGVVPDYMPAWDYGRTARAIAAANRRVDSAHRGFQVVQTQPNCGNPSAPGPLIGPLAAELRRQYRPILDLVSTEHLGFEISFGTTPNPRASEAVDRIGPGQAAACSEQVLAAGGAGILYWATPDSLGAMFATPSGERLRPGDG
jgi:hypothetical protein